MQNCHSSIDHLAPLGEPEKKGKIKISSILYSAKEELILYTQKTRRKTISFFQGENKVQELLYFYLTFPHFCLSSSRRFGRDASTLDDTVLPTSIGKYLL